MSIDPFETPTGAAGDSARPVAPPMEVLLLGKRNCEPDLRLFQFLERELPRRGFDLQHIRHQSIGLDWAEQLYRQIGDADAVVLILSAASAQSELFAFEAELARESSASSDHRISPILVTTNYTGPVPAFLATLAPASPPLAWSLTGNAEVFLTELTDRLNSIRTAKSSPPTGKPQGPTAKRIPPAAAHQPIMEPIPETEPGWGAVPLQSDFYIARPVDTELKAALLRQDSTILIKGARQMGKTSLLARGLQRARERGCKAVFSDLQKLDAAYLESANSFYFALAQNLVEQLDLSTAPDEVWDAKRGANSNFDRFLRRHVLAKLNTALVWGLDEADRLFPSSFGSEVFGLFRAWHNERALDPAGPWAGLTLVIVYATEAHLFISDLNQSPFNIGTRLALADFNSDQVAELNRRHGTPLANEPDLKRFIDLVSGQPYLVRRGLHEIKRRGLTIEQLEAEAVEDDGIFGEHLRRLLVVLVRDPGLTDVVRGVLRGDACPNPESFYRLRSAGVLSGESHGEARLRCRLYTRFLTRHLC